MNFTRKLGYIGSILFYSSLSSMRLETIKKKIFKKVVFIRVTRVTRATDS